MEAFFTPNWASSTSFNFYWADLRLQDDFSIGPEPTLFVIKKFVIFPCCSAAITTKKFCRSLAAESVLQVFEISRIVSAIDRSTAKPALTVSTPQNVDFDFGQQFSLDNVALVAIVLSLDPTDNSYTFHVVSPHDLPCI